MSIRRGVKRRPSEGTNAPPPRDERTAMSHKNAWKDELWNVSLLPTVNVAQDSGPPPSPAPRGGAALNRPALLSLAEASTVVLSQAA